MEKDKAPEWRRVKAQVEKDEGPEAETWTLEAAWAAELAWVAETA